MTAPTEVRSKRGRRLRGEEAPGVMEQIRMVPQGNTGGWCYYLRPDGATIREALVISPNGGVPDIDDPRLRARYGTNSAEYRAIAQRKGYIPIGPTLTPEAVTKLVEILAENRPDALLYFQEEQAKARNILETSFEPSVKEQAGKRISQFQRQIDTMLAPFDPDELLAELKEIAQANMLANVDPNVLRVMRAMVGEVNEKMASMVQRFAAGKKTSTVTSDDGMGTTAVPGRRARLKNPGDDFSGADFIDVDR